MSPVLAYAIGAAVLRLPVNLKGKIRFDIVTDFSLMTCTINIRMISLHNNSVHITEPPVHPQGVGAWWLGYIICSVI